METPPAFPPLIIGQVENAFATETVDVGLIHGKIKPNIIKLVFSSFASHSAIKETVWSLHRGWYWLVGG